MPDTPTELLSKYSIVSEAEKIEIFNTLILPGYTNVKLKTEVNDAPEVVILGGQPGAGKTELTVEAISILRGNAVECNGDDFRTYHPMYEEIIKESPDYYPDLTFDFASDLNNMLIEYCLNNRINFILETTFSSLSKMNTTIRRFKKKGYIVNVVMLAVNPNISYLNTMNRYEKMLEDKKAFARKVGIARHDSRYPLVEKTLKLVEKERIYDHIYIYGRAGIAAQQGKKNGLVLKEKDCRYPLSVYKKERDKQWSNEDKHYFMQSALLLAEKMVKRDASMDELRELFHYYNFTDYT